MTLDPQRAPVRLGTTTMDWGRLCLARADATVVKLTPKAAAVLQLLLDARGATVSRARIFDEVWPGSASSDEVLTQVVTELRRAFGERARESRTIETIPKLGYRWVGPAPVALEAPVAAADRASTPPRAGALEAAAPQAPHRSRRGITLALGLAALALVAVAARLVPSAREPARPVRDDAARAELPTPVTSEPGLELDPDLSDDGTQLVYVHRDGDAVTLRVRALGSTVHRAIALDPHGTPSAPSFSPDARSLAYLWRGDGAPCEVRVVALDGGAPRTLAQGCPPTLPSSLDWSPDAHYIVFSRAVPADETPAGRQVAIMRVPAAGGAVERLSHADASVVNDVHPRYSDDGGSIVFVRDGDGRNRVVVLGPDGSETEVPLPFWPYRAVYARDALLVAAHARTSAEIWRRDADGALAPIARGAAGPGLAVSRDGALAVFEQHRSDDNLWRYALTPRGSEPRQLTLQTRSERSPRVAPDGSGLAYIADESGAPEVYLDDLHGTRRALSNFAPNVPLDLRWSPDARHLAVVLGTARGKSLAILARDGSLAPLPARIAGRAIEQVEFANDGHTLWMTATSSGRRELRRVAFPAFDADVLAADFAVASISLDRADGTLYLQKPREAALFRYDAAASAPVDTGITTDAAPADQWQVDSGRLAQVRHGEPGADSVLTIARLDAPHARRTIRFRIAMPLLGRDFELDGDTLVLARRDAEEADLHAVVLAPAGPRDAIASDRTTPLRGATPR